MRNAVTDYLLNLSEHDLCLVSSDFLDTPIIDASVASQWVDDLSNYEVKMIWELMEGEYKLSQWAQSQMEGE